MSKRLKLQTLKTEREFHSTLNAIAALQAAANKVIAKRDAEIVAIQQRYAGTLDPITHELAALVALAEAYADEHRAELLPKDRKSVDTATCTYGWRTGNRTVRPLNKQWTEAKIIEALEHACLDDYVREVKEIAKDKILADCEDNKTLAQPAAIDEDGDEIIPAETIALADVGVKITQSESFYIEPKAESGETLKASEAVV
jgi:phage host-nuclease inhibitor protein Gam